MMKTIFDLQQAVEKVFDKKLKKVNTPGVYWQQFIPFQVVGSQTNLTLLLKLIKVPSNFRTSEEIIQNTKNRFRNLIHQVDFILVERNFEYITYLLSTKENLVSVQSYLEIKNKAKEIIEVEVIDKFIQFSSQLESHPLSSAISFGLNQVGITKCGQFLLTNYKTYFIQEKQQNKNINKDIRYILFKLLLPNQQQIDLSQLYSYVQQNYNRNILSIVQKFLAYPDSKASELLSTKIVQAERNLMETTLTDSFHNSTVSGSQIQNISGEIADLQASLLKGTPNHKYSKNKFKKIAFFAIFFVVILLIIGTVTFKYLNPRPLSCLDKQYLDKNQNICLSCDPSCDTCSEGTNVSCLSCREGLYLVKKDRSERVGKCSNSCSGTKLKSNVCIFDYS